MKKLCLLLLLVPFVCLSQVITSDDVVLCDGEQGQVEVTLTATSYPVDLTDSGIAADDIFGGIVNINFDFVFYGNTYNQVVLSSNNYLSFNTSNANAYSDYTIGAAIPTNLEPETQNGILCPWQDINPGADGNGDFIADGTIAYATIGEAPNRIFIVSFCGIPMFQCTDICYSSQIKLFESTNIIETHIAQKVLCTTWNDGAAIHGLHNIDGTIAHVVTGLDGIERNYPNQWQCENDGWRFTPNGSADYIIESIEFAPAVAGTNIIWQDGFGNQIGIGEEITVVPAGNATYTAGTSLCGPSSDWCGFEGGIEGNDITIVFENCPDCTYPSACNYNPDATEDDGSCEWISCYGCSDPEACNYDPSNTFDDGSCVYVDGVCETCLDNVIIDNDFDNDGICDSEDLCQGFDDAEDFDNDLIPDACDICPNDSENDSDNDGVCADNEIFGCTYENACNYNPDATEDDGSCLFSFIDICEGCTDLEACNYNPNANTDNGSCEYDSCVGCADFWACNYSSSATQDDGSCIYPNVCGSCEDELFCLGCTDPSACNYDAAATEDDNSCEYPEFGYNCEGVFIITIEPGDLILCEGEEAAVELIVPEAYSINNDFNDSNIYSDDVFSDIIGIGFNFEFYGNLYSHVVLSSNNYLSFNLSEAGGYSPWAIGAPVPESGSYSTLNAILAPWQDTYPGVNGDGQIGYAVIGEAPNRVFVASYCGVPMFSCADLWAGAQIKLYESTNVIETHIVKKVLCESWNSGAAIHGLQNSDGTLAHVVTGSDGIERNYPNLWEATDDAWRFTPNGNNDYTIESIAFSPAVAESIIWYDQNGNIIGGGDSVFVYPEENTSYSAISSYCDNTEIIIGNVNVFFEECEGCPDPNSCNYDPDANPDEGFCDYSCYGCTNPDACNYDSIATEEDNSCIYPGGPCLLEINEPFGEIGFLNDICECVPYIFGCMDDAACNYNPDSNTEDGSCIYNPIDSSLTTSCTGSCDGSIDIELNSALWCFYCVWYNESGEVVSYSCSNLGDVCAGTYTLVLVDECELSGCQEEYLYEINCSSTSIEELSNNKKLIATIDILGRETNNNEGFLLHIYDDGSVEKKYLIK